MMKKCVLFVCAATLTVLGVSSCGSAGGSHDGGADEQAIQRIPEDEPYEFNADEFGQE